MDERNTPQQPQEEIIPTPPRPLPMAHETGKRELCLAGLILVFSIALCNFILYGGFQLAFALGTAALISCSIGYLLLSGHRFDWYSGALLLLSLVIALGFGRSDDGFVKFVLLQFLMLSINLGLCLLAKQNRRSPNAFSSLLDVPRTVFMLGIGEGERAFRGLGRACKNSGAAGKKGGAVALGLLISVPILAVLIPLLMDADAAFEGLLNLLPETDFTEYFVSALWGTALGALLYSRGVALHRAPKPAAPRESGFRGMNSLTVSTILTAVCALYCVYLLSQLAYLSGGFAGILPEEFTMAEYARRGFFEMAWLCAINLSIICTSVWLVKKQPGTPKFVRLCCLFIGIVTIFLVATASAKMFMYIGSYGLTRLRVLTEVIMVWLGITTVLVCLWLFVPKMPYMKAVVLTALVMGAAVLWADVDTQVARYNVRSYQSGQLETVDVDYLANLSSGAVPYLQELAEDDDPVVAKVAKLRLERIASLTDGATDWRSWNWTDAAAQEILDNYRED